MRVIKLQKHALLICTSSAELNVQYEEEDW